MIAVDWIWRGWACAPLRCNYFIDRARPNRYAGTGHPLAAFLGGVSLGAVGIYFWRDRASMRRAREGWAP